jgi:N-acetyl-anhydromuramyl-L-alanine amidase AmpD
MWRRRAALCALTLALVACSSGGDERAPSVSAASGPLARAFDESARDAAVPRDLLVAIAHVEDGLGVPAERLDLHETAVPAAGPLMLRHGKLDTLARGAALVSASELDLRRDADLALRAGARVLAELGRRTGASPADLASWKAAIEEMSGYADDAHREQYAHRVFATLARGGTFAGRDGEAVTLGRHDLPPALVLDVSSRLETLTTAQFPGAEWIPTSCKNKCTQGRAGHSIEYVVIHDTEGGWNASVATLQNDPQKSVQYIVGTDGHVAQFVTEETTAWHAGNLWYNQRSVGIEHVGFANQPYPEAEYAASAKLVDYLATKYGVARDREHVIGHDQIPDGTRIGESSAPCEEAPSKCEKSSNYGGAANHDDPGVWEWATYMPRIGGAAKCNDVGSLWSCSNDATQAFRCAGGSVELVTCDGPGACESKAKGQDDVCNVAPQSEAPATPVPNEVPHETSAPLPPAAGAAAREPLVQADTGGCSASPSRLRGSRGSRGSRGELFALALVVAGVGRRRRHKA